MRKKVSKGGEAKADSMQSAWNEHKAACADVGRKKSFQTTSGIEIPNINLNCGFNPTSTSSTSNEEQYLTKLGFPGQFPYTRGIHPTMYRSRLWTMRQYSGFGTAEATNKRYHYLLSKGITGLSVAFDLPTQMGRDSDHPLAQGEVGRVGVAIDTSEDMDRLFAEIELEKVSVSMTINATAHILLALYIVTAEKRGISPNQLRGTIQNDVLKEYIARGTYIYPPVAALKITTDIFEYCKNSVPEWNTISISGYHIREAGSTAVQELAFTLADGIAYVEAAIKRGLDVDSFAPRLAFFFNCHNNFLEEIAKFRAARRMWAKIMRDRFGAKDPRSLILRFHTQTAGSTLTAQQPEVNIVRTTIQALAAVLGGTQSLHTNAYDEAIGLPTEETAQLALRTQQVIALESGVADHVDPFGGSYTIEYLTDELEHRAGEIISRIDGIGGMVAAIESDFPQRAIEDSAYEAQKSIEKKEALVVGINAFSDLAQGSEPDVISQAMKIDPEEEKKQVRSLLKWKQERDHKAVEIALAKLRKSVAEGSNIMPAVVDAVRDRATVGEISDELRAIFGEYGG